MLRALIAKTTAWERVVGLDEFISMLHAEKDWLTVDGKKVADLL